mmetsp:Transcript_10844/g.21261  ORF Transcript_10844/g.21261 Transcript_10844/m.21261 type:complete len:584 (+) Transcript_10844:202-1953(+)
MKQFFSQVEKGNTDAVLGHLQCCPWLVGAIKCTKPYQYCTDVDPGRGCTSKTQPLFEAIKHMHIPVINVLLEYNASLEWEDDNKNNARRHTEEVIHSRSAKQGVLALIGAEDERRQQEKDEAKQSKSDVQAAQASSKKELLQKVDKLNPELCGPARKLSERTKRPGHFSEDRTKLNFEHTKTLNELKLLRDENSALRGKLQTALAMIKQNEAHKKKYDSLIAERRKLKEASREEKTALLVAKKLEHEKSELQEKLALLERRRADEHANFCRGIGRFPSVWNAKDMFVSKMRSFQGYFKKVAKDKFTEEDFKDGLWKKERKEYIKALFARVGDKDWLGVLEFVSKSCRDAVIKALCNEFDEGSSAVEVVNKKFPSWHSKVKHVAPIVFGSGDEEKQDASTINGNMSKLLEKAKELALVFWAISLCYDDWELDYPEDKIKGDTVEICVLPGLLSGVREVICEPKIREIQREKTEMTKSLATNVDQSTVEMKDALQPVGQNVMIKNTPAGATNEGERLRMRLKIEARKPIVGRTPHTIKTKELEPMIDDQDQETRIDRTGVRDDQDPETCKTSWVLGEYGWEERDD